MINEGTSLKKIDRSQITSVRAVRRCPECGRKLYMKLEDCTGRISIKCPKCGRTVCMNLALRRAN